MDLSNIFDEGYFEREGWCDFKNDLLRLLESLAGYVEYLSKINKVIKIRHKSLAPVRELSTNLHLKFLPASSTDHSHFDSVSSDIEKACLDVQPYDSINLFTFLSCETTKRRKEVEKITLHGLSCGPVFFSHIALVIISVTYTFYGESPKTLNQSSV